MIKFVLVAVTLCLALSSIKKGTCQQTPSRELLPFPSDVVLTSSCFTDSYGRLGCLGMIGVAAGYTIPWTAMLSITSDLGNKELCGASLIAREWLLTAAHCLVRKNRLERQFRYAQSITVYLGANEVRMIELEPGVEKFTTNIFHIHPNYNAETFNYDFALIKVPANLTSGGRINLKLIRLPAETACRGANGDLSALVKDGCPNITVRAAGWGKTENGRVSERLLYMNLELKPFSVCQGIFDDDDQDFEAKLCAKGPQGQDTCYGDSGGPLYCSDTLVGVVSYGNRDCSFIVPSPAVYSRVCSALSWIYSIIDPLRVPPTPSPTRPPRTPPPPPPSPPSTWCTVPTIQNGNLVTSDSISPVRAGSRVPSGSSLLLRCQMNFGIAVGGNSRISCLEDETWSGNVGQCRQQCPVPAVENGHFEYKDNVIEADTILTGGERINLHCDDGYQVSTPAARIRVCSSVGQFTPPIDDPQCIPDE